MAGPPHRSVSSIKPSATGGPTTPHAPIRTPSSNFASPSTLRAEEEHIILELGSRYLRAGFSADPCPKVVIGFGPEEQRRVGDYRQWQKGYDTEWRKRAVGREWGEGYELWKLDLRSTDLGLVGDKFVRAYRQALSKHLLLDYRPRSMTLVLPSVLPLPLLTTILDTIFENFPTPNISLLASPVLSTIAAGLRAALVIDIGWAETVATAIYEYHEVRSQRTIRARKELTKEMLKLLGDKIPSAFQDHTEESKSQGSKEYLKAISFEECEDVVGRLAWCRASKHRVATPERSQTLPSVEEEDEGSKILPSVEEKDEEEEDDELWLRNLRLLNKPANSGLFTIPLETTQPPMTLELPFSMLAEPCENALFADGIAMVELDDEELPLHLLVYNTLLNLPVDVRSVCMSRIIFTGTASTIPGLKARVRDELEALIRARDWDPVYDSKGEGQQHHQGLGANRKRQVNDGPIVIPDQGENLSGSSKNPALEESELDPIEEKIQREAQKGKLPRVQGTVRIVESMGSWAGASLVTQLKIPVVCTIERDQWLQFGAAGASKHGEVTPLDELQSAFRAAGGEPKDPLSWTLGPWG